MNAKSEKAQIQYLNPEALHTNPAYSQAISVEGRVKTLYIGGQNAVDNAGELVGKGDLRAQTGQALRNVQAILEAAGAEPEHVIKWNIHVVQGLSIQEGFAAFQDVWGQQANAPVITFAFIAGLAHPDYLVELDATAVVPLE